MNEDQLSAFVAYPSSPPMLEEALENAIQRSNEYGLVKLVGWRELKMGGVPVISEICSAINEHPVFIADITHHNPNVLFELGYAIAKKKRIWLLFDPSTNRARDRFAQIGLLNWIGYHQYANSDDILNGLAKEFMSEVDLNATYNKLVAPVLAQGINEKDIFYLKSYRANEASNKLTTVITDSGMSIITDDPSERSPENITWYIKHASGCQALIAHLDSDEVDDAAPTNAKYGFVSGFAYGLGKPILMLALEPYACPLDYQMLIKSYDRAAICVEHAKTWLNDTERQIMSRRRQHLLHHKSVQNREFLASLSVGEHVAENETDNLHDYFITTGPFNNAINAKLCLFIGRKGTGKTANLLCIQRVLSENKWNHVCTIKPQSYDVEAVLSSLKNIRAKAEMGGVYIAVWKYLIYSELCLSINDALRKMNPAGLSNDQRGFIAFCDTHFLNERDFADRLQMRVSQIEDIVNKEWNSETPVRLSERLHSSFISEMLEHISVVMRDTRRIAILVDNLDKAWKARDDMAELCDLLLGLLAVMGSIALDLKKRNPEDKRSMLRSLPS